MKWVKEGVVALVATTLAVFIGPKDWLSIVTALVMGVGVSVIIFGGLLLRRIRKIDLLPLIATDVLLFAPWLKRVNSIQVIDSILIVLSAAAALVLAYKFYTMLQHEAGEKDDDVRKGGYEVWK